MKHQVEKLEHSMVKLTIEISPEEFDSGVETAYRKNKNSISIPGFRKGKAPRHMVEKIYGKEVFYEDGLNEILPDLYQQAVAEEELEVMSRPEVSIDSMKPEEGVVVSMEVAVKPPVELGTYKGLKKEQEPVEVTDEDLEEELKNMAKRNARAVNVTDRAVQMDDTVTIDFEGFMDGVPFDGGKGEDHPLKIGSHSFIDSFEDQLIGKNVGDECEVNVTFPEDYQQKDLAGKPALFKVTIKKIRYDEVPEIDDELVQEVSTFKTLEEYKADLKEKLLEQKTRQAESALKNKLLTEVAEASTIDFPEAIINEQCDQMINDFANTLRYQGMDMQRYMSATGSTIASLRESVRPEAEKRLKENLVLEAVAKAEGLEVTEEDINKEYENLASMYGMELDRVKAMFGQSENDNMKAELLNRKALDFLVANAE